MADLRKRLISLLCSCFFALGSFSAYGEAVQLDLDAGKALGLKLEILRNIGDRVDIETIRRLPALSWEKSTEAEPFLGASSKAHWARFKVQSSREEVAVLEMRWPLVSSLKVYHFYNGSLVGSWTGGISEPVTEDNARFRFPSIDLNLKAGDNQIFIRQKSDNFLRFPLFIYSASQFAAYARQDMMINFLALGCVFGLVLYNLFLFLRYREPSILFYVIYTAALIAFETLIQGLAFQMAPVGQVSAFAFERWTIVFGLVTMTFVCPYAKSYLNLPKISPKLSFLFDLCMMVTIVGIVGWLFLSVSVHAYVSSITNLLVAALLLCSGIFVSFHRYRPAYYFLIAWTIFLIGDALTVLNILGLLPSVFVTKWGILLGMAIKGVLMSIGLGDRLYQIRAQKEQLEQEYSEIKVSIDDAKSVQESLVSNPSIQGLDVEVYSEAADFLGGDWYGLFRSKNQDKVYLGIGDVTGHSLSSSLVTGAVAGAFHYGVQELDEVDLTLETSLTHLASNINKVILRDNKIGTKMMTMGFFAMDLQTKEYAYLSAGHLPIFVLGEKVQTKVSFGSPLGLVAEPIYKPVLGQLQNSETLFFYTDGLIENAGLDGKTLGLKGLAAQLRGDNKPSVVVERVKRETSKIWKSGQGEDDTTFVALKSAS